MEIVYTMHTQQHIMQVLLIHKYWYGIAVLQFLTGQQTCFCEDL